MKDLTKVFIDLSKCSEEQIKEVERVTQSKVESLERWVYLIYHKGQWDYCHPDYTGLSNKQELTYPEFIKLFEGGEDNNGWIKIESESDLPKEGMMNYFICVDAKPSIHPVNLRLLLSLYNDGMVSHYQPIQLPESPKF